MGNWAPSGRVELCPFEPFAAKAVAAARRQKRTQIDACFMWAPLDSPSPDRQTRAGSGLFGRVHSKTLFFKLSRDGGRDPDSGSSRETISATLEVDLCLKTLQINCSAPSRPSVARAR